MLAGRPSWKTNIYWIEEWTQRNGKPTQGKLQGHWFSIVKTKFSYKTSLGMLSGVIMNQPMRLPISITIKTKTTIITSVYSWLVYTTQVNSAFRARWLASSEVISQVLFTSAAEEKQNGFRRYIVTNKVTLWAASYSVCVVYTKTIIHFSVGESGGYLHPLRWIIVNYNALKKPSERNNQSS